MFLALVFIEKAQYNVNTTTNVNATNVDNTEFTILEKYWLNLELLLGLLFPLYCYKYLL